MRKFNSRFTYMAAGHGELAMLSGGGMVNPEEKPIWVSGGGMLSGGGM